jgi:hypothetical protein
VLHPGDATQANVLEGLLQLRQANENPLPAAH